MIEPDHIALMGEEVAVKWKDGSENYYPMSYLRKMSPSASNQGESDLLGNRYGGTDQTEFPDVRVKGWNFIGGYAVQFHFTDGHQTGLYSYDYLKKLAENL